LTDAAIPAATILLLRDEPAFEVLMIERHADTPFAGGAIVFPGGRIEASDASPAWRAHCDGEDEVPAGEFGPRVAAIREAFEESGVLLARKDGVMLSNEAAAGLDGERSAVETDDALFIELIKANGLTLALDALHLYARWEPPKRGHENMRRYHTWFFAAKTPPGQEAREDGNEATEAFWASPGAILKSCDAGARKAIFPTLRNLELLDVSDSAAGVFDFAATRKIETVMPEIVKRDGAHVLMIPDDMGYPVTEESLETAFRS
jgi:8-oxo-dGTP pyrophosphatase MutT (NUDIX family)